MCGIVAYFGKKAAQPILLEGLRRLEYRGYDSAGIALINKKGIKIKKTSGRIIALEKILDEKDDSDTLGIGHTRWATHGEPNTTNAHPHLDYTGKIAVVHNGIIENYSTLKTWLQNEGAEFASQTDTEVIANLIGYFYAKTDNYETRKQSDSKNKFERAVQQALRELAGTYGLAIVCSDFPDMIIGAKKGSPLILGIGENEYISSPRMRPRLWSTPSRQYTLPTMKWLPSVQRVLIPRLSIMLRSTKVSSKSNFRWNKSSWAVSRIICSRKSLNSLRFWLPVWVVD